MIDDPLKDHEEAHSPTMREKVWNWFLSVAYTRLSPVGAVVIIMSRWHTDDLVGRLLDPRRNEEMEHAGVKRTAWRVVNLPAMAKDGDLLRRQPGESLFPEFYPAGKILEIRATLGSYLSSALYDGQPIPAGGRYMDVGAFNYTDSAPDGFWVRFWDLATDEKEASDYTAGVRAHVAHDVHTDHAPKAIGPYSQAICIEGLIFTAGQGGLDPATMELV